MSEEKKDLTNTEVEGQLARKFAIWIFGLIATGLVALVSWTVVGYGTVRVMDARLEFMQSDIDRLRIDVNSLSQIREDLAVIRTSVNSIKERLDRQQSVTLQSLPRSN